jgi:hypothetical protein
MAEIDGQLWHYNLARIIVLDVTDDYRLMQEPLPSNCYPVLADLWVPLYDIDKRLASKLVPGYLYDWHETPERANGIWYVGVVHQTMLSELDLELPLPATINS